MAERGASMLSKPSAPPAMRGMLLRSCDGGAHTPGGNAAVAGLPVVVHEVLRSPGQRFDPTVRRGFEHGFWHDVSRVRGHADGRAARSAHAVGAQACTAHHGDSCPGFAGEALSTWGPE